VADVAGDIILIDLDGADLPPQFALLRQAFPVGPVLLQFLRRADGAPLAFGHYAQEIAFAHNLDQAGNVLDRTLTDAHQRRTDSGRSHDTAVQYPGQPEILHVGELARHFSRDVEARNGLPHDLVGCRVFERRLLIDLQ